MLDWLIDLGTWTCRWWAVWSATTRRWSGSSGRTDTTASSPTIQSTASSIRRGNDFFNECLRKTRIRHFFVVAKVFFYACWLLAPFTDFPFLVSTASFQLSLPIKVYKSEYHPYLKPRLNRFHYIRYFSAHCLKLTLKFTVETKEIIMDEVAKGLDLNPNRFRWIPLFVYWIRQCCYEYAILIYKVS